MNNNPSKTYSKTLNLLIQTLCKLNYSLALELQTNSFTYNKLIMICKAIPDFKITYQKPALMISGLISNLWAMATSYDRLNLIRPETLFTDHRYHGSQSND